MRWLHADGCPMNYLATAYAAMDGKIDMLKWLRDRGCEWNASACALAAASGDLKTLKYLRDNGCPWNLATTLFAQRQAYFADPKDRQRSPCRDVAAWAAQNGLPGHKWYSDTAPNKRDLIAFGDVTKAALDLWVDDVEGAGLFEYRECRWQDRDRDIDALIAFAMRQEFNVRNGFGAAAYEPPPSRCEPLRGGGDDGPRGGSRRADQGGEGVCLRARRRRLGRGGAGVWRQNDGPARRRGEAFRSVGVKVHRRRSVFLSLQRNSGIFLRSNRAARRVSPSLHLASNHVDA